MARPGVALASGMGAIHAALASLVRAGDRIVGAAGGLRVDADPARRASSRGFGVDVEFVDMTDLDAVDGRARRGADPGPLRRDHRQPDDRRHRPRRRSPSWPTGTARRTSSTTRSPRPYVCRPLELGADLVVESATKFLGGHSDVIAGVVAGSAGRDRRASSAVQVDTGATLGPLDAFLVLRGILTLGVRAERHAANAAALAAWLERQDGVQRVLYPGLPSHPQHDVAVRQFRAGRRRDARVRGRGRSGGRARASSMR